MEKMNVTIKDIGSHQAHVMMGTKGYDIHHPMRITLYLLNNILGGPSMNARLNLALWLYVSVTDLFIP